MDVNPLDNPLMYARNPTSPPYRTSIPSLQAHLTPSSASSVDSADCALPREPRADSLLQGLMPVADATNVGSNPYMSTPRTHRDTVSRIHLPYANVSPLTSHITPSPSSPHGHVSKSPAPHTSHGRINTSNGDSAYMRSTPSPMPSPFFNTLSSAGFPEMAASSLLPTQNRDNPPPTQQSYLQHHHSSMRQYTPTPHHTNTAIQQPVTIHQPQVTPPGSIIALANDISGFFGHTSPIRPAASVRLPLPSPTPPSPSPPAYSSHPAPSPYPSAASPSSSSSLSHPFLSTSTTHPPYAPNPASASTPASASASPSIKRSRPHVRSAVTVTTTPAPSSIAAYTSASNTPSTPSMAIHAHVYNMTTHTDAHRSATHSSAAHMLDPTDPSTVKSYNNTIRGDDSSNNPENGFGNTIFRNIDQVSMLLTALEATGDVDYALQDSSSKVVNSSNDSSGTVVGVQNDHTNTVVNTADTMAKNTKYASKTGFHPSRTLSRTPLPPRQNPGNVSEASDDSQNTGISSTAEMKLGQCEDYIQNSQVSEKKGDIRGVGIPKLGSHSGIHDTSLPSASTFVQVLESPTKHSANQRPAPFGAPTSTNQETFQMKGSGNFEKSGNEKNSQSRSRSRSTSRPRVDYTKVNLRTKSAGHFKKVDRTSGVTSDEHAQSMHRLPLPPAKTTSTNRISNRIIGKRQVSSENSTFPEVDINSGLNVRGTPAPRRELIGVSGRGVSSHPFSLPPMASSSSSSSSSSFPPHMGIHSEDHENTSDTHLHAESGYSEVNLGNTHFPGLNIPISGKLAEMFPGNVSLESLHQQLTTLPTLHSDNKYTYIHPHPHTREHQHRQMQPPTQLQTHTHMQAMASSHHNGTTFPPTHTGTTPGKHNFPIKVRHHQASAPPNTPECQPEGKSEVYIPILVLDPSTLQTYVRMQKLPSEQHHPQIFVNSGQPFSGLTFPCSSVRDQSLGLLALASRDAGHGRMTSGSHNAGTNIGTGIGAGMGGAGTDLTGMTNDVVLRHPTASNTTTTPSAVIAPDKSVVGVGGSGGAAAVSGCGGVAGVGEVTGDGDVMASFRAEWRRIMSGVHLSHDLTTPIVSDAARRVVSGDKNEVKVSSVVGGAATGVITGVLDDASVSEKVNCIHDDDVECASKKNQTLPHNDKDTITTIQKNLQDILPEKSRNADIPKRGPSEVFSRLRDVKSSLQTLLQEPVPNFLLPMSGPSKAEKSTNDSNSNASMHPARVATASTITAAPAAMISTESASTSSTCSKEPISTSASTLVNSVQEQTSVCTSDMPATSVVSGISDISKGTSLPFGSSFLKPTLVGSIAQRLAKIRAEITQDEEKDESLTEKMSFGKKYHSENESFRGEDHDELEEDEGLMSLIRKLKHGKRLLSEIPENTFSSLPAIPKSVIKDVNSDSSPSYAITTHINPALTTTTATFVAPTVPAKCLPSVTSTSDVDTASGPTPITLGAPAVSELLTERHKPSMLIVKNESKDDIVNAADAKEAIGSGVVVETQAVRADRTSGEEPEKEVGCTVKQRYPADAFDVLAAWRAGRINSRDTDANINVVTPNSTVPQARTNTRSQPQIPSSSIFAYSPHSSPSSPLALFSPSTASSSSLSIPFSSTLHSVSPIKTPHFSRHSRYSTNTFQMEDHEFDPAYSDDMNEISQIRKNRAWNDYSNDGVDFISQCQFPENQDEKHRTIKPSRNLHENLAELSPDSEVLAKYPELSSHRSPHSQHVDDIYEKSIILARKALQYTANTAEEDDDNDAVSNTTNVFQYNDTQVQAHVHTRAHRRTCTANRSPLGSPAPTCDVDISVGTRVDMHVTYTTKASNSSHTTGAPNITDVIGTNYTAETPNAVNTFDTDTANAGVRDYLPDTSGRGTQTHDIGGGSTDRSISGSFYEHANTSIAHHPDFGSSVVFTENEEDTFVHGLDITAVSSVFSDACRLTGISSGFNGEILDTEEFPKNHGFTGPDSLIGEEKGKIPGEDSVGEVGANGCVEKEHSAVEESEVRRDMIESGPPGERKESPERENDEGDLEERSVETQERKKRRESVYARCIEIDTGKDTTITVAEAAVNEMQVEEQRKVDDVADVEPSTSIPPDSTSGKSPEKALSGKNSGRSSSNASKRSSSRTPRRWGKRLAELAGGGDAIINQVIATILK